AQVISLDEAISTALQNNFNIQLARIDSTSAAIDNSYANAAFIPQLNGAAGRTWNNNSQKLKFSNSPDRDASGLKSNNMNASINLNWELFDGLRMFATKQKVAELTELGGLNVRSSIT